MGAKAATIWYVDAPDPLAVLRENPESDHAAARALAGRLFPDLIATPTSPAPLSAGAGVVADEIFIGCYPSVTVVCSPKLAAPRPSEIPSAWVRPLASDSTFLVAFDPRHQWGAFGIWDRGALRRAFSATNVHIHEDRGLPLTWELPFWSGEHPIEHPAGTMPDPQSLPFDPQQFADAANRQWLNFGYREQDSIADTTIVTGFVLHEQGAEPAALHPHQPTFGSDHEGRFTRPKWLRRWSHA